MNSHPINLDIYFEDEPKLRLPQKEPDSRTNEFPVSNTSGQQNNSTTAAFTMYKEGYFDLDPDFIDCSIHKYTSDESMNRPMFIESDYEGDILPNPLEENPNKTENSENEGLSLTPESNSSPENEINFVRTGNYEGPVFDIPENPEIENPNEWPVRPLQVIQNTPQNTPKDTLQNAPLNTNQDPIPNPIPNPIPETHFNVAFRRPPKTHGPFTQEELVKGATTTNNSMRKDNLVKGTITYVFRFLIFLATSLSTFEAQLYNKGHFFDYDGANVKVDPVYANEFRTDLNVQRCRQRAQRRVKEILTQDGENVDFVRKVEEHLGVGSMTWNFLNLTFVQAVRVWTRQELFGIFPTLIPGGIQSALDHLEAKIVGKYGRNYFDRYAVKFRETALDFERKYTGRVGRKARK